MLLFPEAIKPSALMATAEGMLSSHYEVRPAPPRLQEIESLLARCEYTSAEDEEGVQPMLATERLSTEQLLRRVQASEVAALSADRASPAKDHPVKHCARRLRSSANCGG